MPSSTYLSLASILLAASTVSAQTFTTCNPLNATCPKDTALGKTLDLTSFSGKPPGFTEQSTGITYKDSETHFSINKKGEAPTLISDFYIFFGSVEVILQASPGTGIVSSVVLESDDLDEIDWEWIGGNTAAAETNYFGKGDTTTYDRATWPAVSSPPQTNYHNYTIVWTPEELSWIVDTVTVRKLSYADAKGGSRYPQTPMKLRIGSWAGGDSDQPKGTIQWAGGVTDYSQGPFTMQMKSLKVTDAHTGSAYEYGDETGSYQSIKVLAGDSSVGSSSSSASASASKSDAKTATKKADSTKTKPAGHTATEDPKGGANAGKHTSPASGASGASASATGASASGGKSNATAPTSGSPSAASSKATAAPSTGASSANAAAGGVVLSAVLGAMAFLL